MIGVIYVGLMLPAMVVIQAVTLTVMEGPIDSEDIVAATFMSAIGTLFWPIVLPSIFGGWAGYRLVERVGPQHLSR